MNYLLKITFAFTATLIITSAAHSQPLERYHTLTDTTYTSKSLGYKKHIQITVPIEYQENLHQDFPLMIVFDTQNKRQYQYILKSIDFLTANEQMPSMVIVGVEAGAGGNRYRETQLKEADSTGIAEKNEDYIFKELIPLIRNKFNAGQFTMLAGHSRYGFLTTYLLAKHVNELNAVVSMSPFIQQNSFDLSATFTRALTSNPPAHTVYYRYAMGNDYPEDYKKLTTALKAPTFKVKNFNADGWWFPDADHNTTPGLTITRALCEIFAYWHNTEQQYLSDSNKSVATLSQVKQRITANYGAEVPCSIALLNGKGNAFYNDKDYANAILAWRELVKQYPNFVSGYLDIAECQKLLKQPTGETIKQFKANLPMSTIFSAAQKAEFLKQAEEFSKD